MRGNSAGANLTVPISNKCPVLLTPAQKKVNVDYQDPKKSTQVYKVPVYEQQCTFDGGYFGSTFSKLPLQPYMVTKEQFCSSRADNAHCLNRMSGLCRSTRCE